MQARKLLQCSQRVVCECGASFQPLYMLHLYDAVMCKQTILQ